MYAEKRLDFLIKACDLIREQVPGFEVLFLGDGSDAPIVQRFAEDRDWAHYVGPQYGTARVPYFLISDVFLMPGLVGLAVLDCFALEVPLLTTNYPGHSPEIAYLENGIDGIISRDSLDAYVAAVVEVLRSQELCDRLKMGCRQKARRYTIQNMVENFSRGVQNALAAP
jgi:glycosyltransferase involved in cell wall biosynthesis